MWMKVDDRLHNHRKTRAVTRSHESKRRDIAPMGLWVAAGSWSSQNGTDGWVPEEELDRWDDDWPALVSRLVKAGYWWPHERDGEPGYGFTDWHDYNDPADLASKSGTYGNHVRWHVNEKRVEPDCEHCPKPPNDRGDIATDSGGDRGAISGGESRFASPPIALPVPDPIPEPVPEPQPIASAIAERRADVDRLCEHLADRIEGNGAKRPTVGQTWRDAARLLLDRDKRAEDDVHRAIDWCQNDEFWRANILSMPKLREKYDQLRMQAQRKNGNRHQQETDDVFARAARHMGIEGR